MLGARFVEDARTIGHHRRPSSERVSNFFGVIASIAGTREVKPAELFGLDDRRRIRLPENDLPFKEPQVRSSHVQHVLRLLRENEVVLRSGTNKELFGRRGQVRVGPDRESCHYFSIFSTE